MPNLYTGFEHVSLEAVDADDSKNTRKTSGLSEESLEAFASRMAAEGQIHPIGLRPKEGGRYELKFGFRRTKAARLLGWPTIWAGIINPAITDDHAEILHHLENLDRESLSTYEIALAATSITKSTSSTISLHDYAKRVGIPFKTVQSYVFWLKDLPPEVTEDWKKAHPMLTMRNLEKLYGMRLEDATRTWAEWKTWHGAGQPGQRPGKTPTNPYRRPSPRKLIKLHSDAEESDLPAPLQKLLLHTIEFAQGARKDPPRFVLPSSLLNQTGDKPVKKSSKKGTRP